MTPHPAAAAGIFAIRNVKMPGAHCGQSTPCAMTRASDPESATTRTSTYPLRLPVSIKAEAEKLAASEGTSLNQFVATAVAEKVASLRTASYFAEHRGRADWAAFDRLMTRTGGRPPRPGDERPGDERPGDETPEG
jgi:hypothetical protein